MSAAEQIGVMLCGHGSRNQNAVDEFATSPKASASAFPAFRSNTAISNSPIR